MRSIPSAADAEPPYDLADEYPFGEPWGTLDTRSNMHPIVADLWAQIVMKFWRRGHPKTNALLHAVYMMSLCRSMRGVTR